MDSTQTKPRGKRRPPYAREFQEARETGRHVNPWLFAGKDAYEYAARRGPGRLVLPEGEDPAAFDWRVVAGLDVVVRWPGASKLEVDALGALLVRSGARSVLVLDDTRYDPEAGLNVVMRPHRRYIARGAA